jgi:hypothetical protein
MEAAAQLVSNRLLARDLEPNDVIVRSIDNYLNSGADPNVLLKALAAVDVAKGSRPMWAGQLRRWMADYAGQAEEPVKPEE